MRTTCVGVVVGNFFVRGCERVRYLSDQVSLCLIYINRYSV